MENKQKLFEIQITTGGESYLLTKQTRSPFVKSDVFVLADYKRSMITLLSGNSIVLDGGKIFFDCEIDKETQVIINSGSHAIEKSPVDFSPKPIIQKTFMQKVAAFFKGDTLPAEIFPSHSFICLQNGEEYHFIGALTESTHTVSFDVCPEKNQVVGKINTSGWVCEEDSLLFDIIEIQGTREFIIKTYFQLTQKLYKKSPKSSPQVDFALIGTADCNSEMGEILQTTDDYIMACVYDSKNELSLSSFIQDSEAGMHELLSSTSEKVVPIASISPYLCTKTSVEYTLFEADIMKNAKGKPIEFVRDGRIVYLIDVFSKSYRGYLARQIDILFSIGFCGLHFCNLDIIQKAIKPGKAEGETVALAYEYLSGLAGDRLTISSSEYPAIARGLFDYQIVGGCVKTLHPNQDKNAPMAAADWDFSGFENIISGHETNSLYPSNLPIAVNSDLMTFDPLLFDLCNVCSALTCKSLGHVKPTRESLARGIEFNFLKEADVIDVINIDSGRFAIIFESENITSACFFNFTSSDWEMEDMTIPPFSFNFQE